MYINIGQGDDVVTVSYVRWLIGIHFNSGYKKKNGFNIGWSLEAKVYYFLLMLVHFSMQCHHQSTKTMGAYRLLVEKTTLTDLHIKEGNNMAVPRLDDLNY